MKNIFTLVLGFLMAASAFAADAAGRVAVYFTGNSDYQVYIDGRGYSSYNSNRIYLNDMRPGQHSIDVYAVKKNNKRSSRPVYSTSFVVRPQTDLNIVVDRNGRVQFDEQRSNNRNWNNRDDRRSNDHNDQNRGYDNRRDDDRNNGYGNNGYGGNGYGNNYTQAMSDADFSQLVQKIRSQWFGSQKLNAAKDGLGRNYFSTYQVRQVLQLFSSESDRLELAKLSYRNVVDQRNFYQLYDVFQQQKNRDELDRYTRDYRY